MTLGVVAILVAAVIALSVRQEEEYGELMRHERQEQEAAVNRGGGLLERDRIPKEDKAMPEPPATEESSGIQTKQNTGQSWGRLKIVACFFAEQIICLGSEPCPITNNERGVLDDLTPDVIATLAKLAKVMNCSAAVEAASANELQRASPQALDEVVAQIIGVSYHDKGYVEVLEYILSNLGPTPAHRRDREDGALRPGKRKAGHRRSAQEVQASGTSEHRGRAPEQGPWIGTGLEQGG